MGKCINKTKCNKEKPVSPCEALCGAVRDPEGLLSAPPEGWGLGPEMCGQFTGVSVALKMGSKTEKKRNPAVVIPQNLRPQKK